MEKYKSESSNNNMSNLASDKKIFNYIKAHPSMVLGLTSGIFVAITYILNLVSFMDKYIYMSFFGFNFNYIDLNSFNTYTFVISLVFIILCILISSFCYTFYEYYYKIF